MRQYISSFVPDKHGHLNVTGKDYKYLRQVLRLQVGNVIETRIPSGELITMTVEKVTNTLLVLSKTENSAGLKETGVLASEIQQDFTALGVPLYLFQFMTKAPKMDLILRQAVEIGVAKIIPIEGQLSSKNEGANRMERWNKIIKEARQQSGSPVATEITPPCTLQKALEQWHGFCGSNPCCIVLNEVAKDSLGLHQCVADFAKRNKEEFSAAAIAVGSEGGISAAELEQLKQANFLPVHLNTNILRAETAAVYGLSALQTILTERAVWL